MNKSKKCSCFEHRYIFLLLSFFLFDLSLALSHRFLSQPFQVAEVFTGSPGKLVPLKETIKGFKMILGGKLFSNIVSQMYSWFNFEFIFVLYHDCNRY